MRAETVRVSIRLTAEQYRLLKLLVDAGAYSSMSDALREAVVRLVRDYAPLLRHAYT